MASPVNFQRGLMYFSDILHDLTFPLAGFQRTINIARRFFHSVEQRYQQQHPARQPLLPVHSVRRGSLGASWERVFRHGRPYDIFFMY